MARHLVAYRRLSICGTLLLTIVIAGGSRQARAAELAEQAHSLRVAPADAAFYSASLRLKEQLDVFLSSRAYARLMEIAVIQLAKGQATFQWQQSPEPTISQVREYIQSPEGEDAVAVLKEMFSDEIFVYAGSDVADAIKLLMDLQGIQRSARLEAAASDRDPGEVMSERMREAFEERADGFRIPTLVFGFRIQNAERATRQLDEVHSLVRKLLEQHRPELAAHLQRDQIAGQEFLTLRLDGSMIPWGEIREEAEADEEELEKWREMVSSKTLVVALGVIDEFVLLSVGSSTDHLERVGQGPFLADQPELGRLARHADERVVSITYLSQSLAQSLSSPEQTIEDLAGTADEILQAAEIADEHRQQIIEDIRALNLKKYMATPGHVAAVAYLTPRGYEGFTYNAGTRPMMDSSKPLTILNHVGGTPMLVVASRSKDTVEDYDEAIRWLRRTAGHVEKIVESKADPDDWAEYLQYRDRGIELLKRLNKANREHLYPAFADRQGAFVMDVSAESKQWVAQMPESPKPLPMLEFGVVASVSDAEQLRQGAKEYYAVVRDAIALVREIHPEEVPEFELPSPEKRELGGGGTLYFYPLPAEWGVDEQVAANLGITDEAAAVSTLPGTTERLLKSTPLSIDTSLDFNRPAAMVAHFEFKKIIEAARPWINYGLDVAMGKLKIENDAELEEAPAEQSPVALQMGFIVPQVEQFLDVATVLRSVSGVTYQEDGVWITHSETHFEDLK